MADVNANIGVNIDTSNALAQLKALQRQISQFHTSIARSSETAGLAQRDLQKNFLNGINAIGSFSAELRTVKTTAESFTESLEKNKFSMREYFRFAGASTKTFGKLFTSEFDTINKVAEQNVKRLQTQYIKMGRDASGAMRAIAIMPNELDMSKMSTQLQMAAQRQSLFNQLVKQGSTNLLNFGKNTQWAGRQLMVGFTLPLAALGMTASRTFMDMETAAIKFRKVYGDLFTPDEERQQALADIEALGQSFTKYGIAVSQTVGLAADAAAAGFQGLDLQRQVTEATRLQILGQLDQQKALETTISLQNAFQLQSEELAEAINFLNAVENQTVVSLDDITTAIPKAAPVVKQLGGDVKDLAFFLTAMKEGGINASEGANALKSGLASLINPTDKARDMMKGFGIDIDSIVNKNAGNVKQTVIEFATALDGLTDLNRQRAIEQLFGKFQLARLSTLFQNVIQDGNQASRVIDLATASTEELATMAESELGITAESAMMKFRKSVEDLKMALVPVGETFLQAVTPILEFVGGILEKFNNLSSGVKKAIVVLTVAIGAIGPVALMTFGLLANALANGIKGLMLLRQGYLRLTGQTQVLGEQTDYLTVEQQRAAAVAHSLDQSHARLTQTFNAEAGAIRNLANEYRNALAALQQFAQRNPGMMMPPKKYNKGIVVVPGSGNKDTVPAMLTPGEAVIPADMTKKYGALIQGMIAGNIPGYKKGRFGGEEPGSGSSGRIGKSGVTIPIPYGKNVSSSSGAVNFLDINSQDFVNMVSIYTKQIAKTAGVSIAEIDREINQWRIANVNAINQATDLVNQGVSAESAFAPLIEKFNKDIAEAGGATSKFAQTAKQMMPKLEQDIVQAQQKAKELSLNVKNSADASRLLAELPENIVAREMATPGPFSSLRKPRQAAASIFGGAEGIGQYGIPRFMVSSQTPTSSPAYLLGSSQEHFSTTTRQSENLEQQKKLRQQAKQNVDSAITETQIAAQTQSPSKRTIPIGEDIARGLEVGMQNRADDVANVGASVAAGATRAMGRGVRTTGPITPGTDFAIEKTQGGVSIPQVANAAIISEATKKSANDMVASAKSFQDRMTGLNRGIMSGTFALGSLAGLASFSGGKLGEFAGVISKLNLAMFALMSVTQLLTQTQFTKLVADRLSLAKGAVKMAKGGGGLAAMPGLVGKSGFAGAIARATFFVVKFVGLMGGITLAVGALALAFKVYKNNQEKTRLAVEGLGDAADLTKSKLKVLGEVFGVVPTENPMLQTAPQVRMTSERRGKVEELKANESFQKEFSKDIEELRKATNKEAELAFKSMALSLSGQGFAPEMIKDITNALREEAGKTDVKIDLKSLDLKTKEGQSGFAQLASDITNELAVAAKNGYKEVTVLKGAINDAGQRSSYYAKELKPTVALQRAADASGQNLFNMFTGLAGQLKNGAIGAKEFNKGFVQIEKALKAVEESNPTTSLLVLKSAIKSLNPETQKFFEGLAKASDITLMFRAQALGLTAILPGLAEALKAVNAGYQGDATYLVQQQQLLEKYMKAIKAAAKETEDFIKKILDGTTEGKKGFLQDEIEALNNQIKAYEKLRIANINAATASELAGNAEMAKLIANTKLTNEMIAKTREYAKLKKQVLQLEIAGASAGDYELSRLQMAQKFVELQHVLIELQSAPTIKKYNEQLEFQELILKNINNRIKSISDAEVLPRETLIKQNNYKLEELSLVEDEINEAYDDQIKYLNKVADLNKKINSLEQSRLSIADALSRGDISEAAQAAQRFRQEEADSRSTTSQDQLANTKELRIAALGRNELEKQNKVLQLQISQIQKNQLDAMELAATGVQNTIDKLNDQLSIEDQIVKKRKESITYLGMTVEQIDNAVKLLETAKDAGINIDVKENLTAFINAAKGDSTSLETLLNTTVPAAAKVAFDELMKLRNAMDLSATITVATSADGAVASIESVTTAIATLNTAAAAAATALIMQAKITIDQTSFDDFNTKITEIDAKIKAMLKDAADILKDGIITDAELAAFAEKWGLALKQAQDFLDNVNAIFKSAVIDKSAIEAFAKEWGIPYTAAVKYLADANAHLIAGTINIEKIQEFATKWGLPYDAVKQYLTDSNKYLSETDIDSASITEYAAKWAEPKNAFGLYKDSVTTGVTSLNALDYSSPGNSAAGGWNTATAAANAYATAAAAAAQAQRDLAAATAAAAAAAKSTSTGTGSSENQNVYKVKPGDTLSSIAAANNVTVGDLLEANPKFENDPKYDKGNKIWSDTTVVIPKKKNRGGLINGPTYMRVGGLTMGSDIVPTTLTPGEFVIRRPAVQGFGVDNLEKINSGEYNNGSVYNYSINVNVKSGSNPDDIARAVMTQIKQVDSQRIRGQRVS